MNEVNFESHRVQAQEAFSSTNWQDYEHFTLLVSSSLGRVTNKTLELLNFSFTATACVLKRRFSSASSTRGKKAFGKFVIELILILFIRTFDIICQGRGARGDVNGERV